jgi:hypothetical protein
VLKDFMVQQNSGSSKLEEVSQMLRDLLLFESNNGGTGRWVIMPCLSYSVLVFFYKLLSVKYVAILNRCIPCSRTGMYCPNATIAPTFSILDNFCPVNPQQAGGNIFG